MMKPALLAAGLALLAPPLWAQDPTPAYQVEQEYKLQIKVDGLARKEWTTDLFGDVPDQDRWRLQLRPRLEASLHWLRLGVGADLNHSSDENTVVEPGGGRPALLRDNYDSKDARLDLAFAAIEARWLRIEGGRFRMPVALTEMLWDRDLRPQGAAVTLRPGGSSGSTRLALTALGARGSHAFEDEDTEMLLLSAGLDLPASGQSRLELTGSYLAFRDIASIEPMIRRQNTRLAGAFVNDYHVVDGILRLRHEGGLPTQFVVDYAWNTSVDQDNKGLWLAAILGSTKLSRSRLEYTYATVDKDATLAAYAGDDFFWATGWAGHRGELAVRVAERGTVHGIAQIIRFKDSPREEERDHWIKRYRVELRFEY
jgi:hypothetical protein